MFTVVFNLTLNLPHNDLMHYYMYIYIREQHLLTCVSDSDGLGITTSARDVHDAFAFQCRHQHGHVLVFRVAVPKAAVVALAPGEELAGDGDGGRVGGAAADVDHLLALQRLDHARVVRRSVQRHNQCGFHVCTCTCMYMYRFT